MDTAKEIEYRETVSGIRHQLDYRMKLFAIGTFLNSLLMIATLQYVDGLLPKLILCAVGASTTIILTLSDKRSASVALQHSLYAVQLEKVVGANLVTEVIDQLNSSRKIYRHHFPYLYVFYFLLWGVIALYSLLSR